MKGNDFCWIPSTKKQNVAALDEKNKISTQDALDKERGHTITDHSIFDQHGRHFEKEPCMLPYTLGNHQQRGD